MKKSYVAVGLFIFLTAATEAGVGIYLGRVVDAIGLRDLQLLLSRLVIECLLTLGNAVFAVFARRLMYRCASVEVGKLKCGIFRRELKRGRGEPVDIANFTSKMDMLYNDYFMSRFFILENICRFALSTIAIISINWIMFFVAVITSVIPFLLPILFKNKVQKAAKAYADESTRYAGFVGDILHGRLEILKYRAEEAYVEKHKQRNDELERKRYGNNAANYLGEQVTAGVGMLMYTGVLFAGGLLVARRIITVGNVLSVVQLMNSTVQPVISIAGYKNKMNSCIPIREDLKSEIREVDKRSPEEELVPDGSVEMTVQGISYRYPGEGRDILHDFSYTFESGKKYLIRGESGCGKTTLARILSGELTAVSGSVTVAGREIGDWDFACRSKIISYVDQKSYVFQDTILHNISLYREVPEEEIRDKIREFRLDAVDIQSFVGEESGISGGEKSRICLARAALDLPGVLIVDEPTAALDGKNADNVVRYLCSLPATVIVIAHGLEEATVRRFDQVLQM